MNGLSFVAAPVIGMVLYEVDTILPFVTSAAVLLIVGIAVGRASLGHR